MLLTISVIVLAMGIAGLSRIIRGLLPVMVFAATPAYAQSSFAERTSMNWGGVGTGIFLGLLVFSIAYNAAFFALLRERFLVWQSARSAAYFALVIGLSPLAMGVFFSADSFARQVYINILFDLGVALTGPFLRNYIEPGMIHRRVYTLLGWPPFAIMLTTPAMLMADCPPLYMDVRNIIMVSMLLLCGFTVIDGWRRGSRTARYQAAAWSGICIVYGTSLFNDIFLHRPFETFLFALFPALGLESILTSLGILDRLYRLQRAHDDARNRADALQIIAHTDPLTGLANRRAFEEKFRAEHPTAVALFDLDHFKSINDRYGHDVGDKVIFATAAALSSGTAFAARIGGEEFALLFYGTESYATAEAEMLRKRISIHVATIPNGPSHRVTASMGMVMTVPEMACNAALKAADVSLYAAKHKGRDRSVMAQAA